MANQEQNQKPLLYKVEPKEGEQVVAGQHPEVQPEIEETSSNKEEKIEQLKREFGVYEALAEVEREKAVALEWVQAYRKEEIKQEPVEQPPVQEVRKQQTVQLQPEPVKEKPVQKRRKKKKKQESVADIIARVIEKGPKNLCEAQLFGETIRFQVLGMRGEVVKIRIGFRVRYIKLSDISQLKVISGE